jgi:2-oxoglutarate ferredoxin oxidoreductase subunit alpha
VPGTPGMEHRIGGLEKHHLSGNISHDPQNHQQMVETRAAKVEGIAADFPPVTVTGPVSGELLVVGWGSTYGAIAQACEQARAQGASVAHLHLRHLNPLPNDLEEVLRCYKHVLVPEMNLGQLSRLLRERYLIDVKSLSKVQGKPFQVAEILERVLGLGTGDMHV